MDSANPTGGGVNATSLSTFKVFEALPLEARSEIARLMRTRSFSAGNYIISTAQKQTDVFFLISGKVRACAFSKNGKPIHFEDLPAGRMFGEISAIDQGERSSDCIAVQDSVLAIMPRDNFLKVIHSYPDVLDAVLQQLVGLVRRQMQRVYEFTSFNVNQRVRFELLRLASAANIDAVPIVIEHPPTHAEIAARISSHREAVTRELKQLEANRVITWKPAEHLIHDIGALTELASG